MSNSFSPLPEFFRNLVNHLPGMFFRCNYDANLTITYLSGNCERVTGYSAQEILYKKNYSFHKMMIPMDQERLLDQYKDNLERHLPCVNEYRIICKYGRMRWMKEIATGVFDDKGKLLSIEGYIEDITAQKDSFHLSSEYFSFQEAVNAGSIVSMTDTKGRIYFANELFCKYSMYSQEELLGKDHRIVNSGHHPKLFFKVMWETINEGKIWRGEIRNKAKDGTYYWVDTVISPIFNEKKEIVNFLSVRNIITSKKEAEEKLLQKERRLKEANEIANLGTWELDLATGKTTWSEEALQIFGLLPHEQNQSYEKFLSFVHPDDRNYVQEVNKNVFETFTGKSFENRIIRRDGTICYIYTKSQFDFNSEGKPVRYYGICQDITGMKEKDNKIAELSDLNRKIIDSSNDLFYLLKNTKNAPFDNQLVFLSSKAINFFGIESTDFINHNEKLANFIHPDDIYNVIEIRKRVFLKMEPAIIQYRILNRMSKKYIWVNDSIKPFATSTGEIIVLYGSMRDITELKEKEIALNKNKEKYENLLNDMNDAYMVDDLDGKVLLANQQFLDFFGLNRKDLENLNLEDYVAPEYRELLRERHNKRVAGEYVPDIFEYEGLKKDGKRIWLEANVTLVYENGICKGTQSVIRNVSERKEKQIELQKTADELTHRYNEIIQFNHIVSHNLRAPVATIMGLVELISIPDMSFEDKLECINHIHTASLKMDEVIRDLTLILENRTALNQSKISVSIPQLLNAITGSLENQLTQSACALKLNLDAEIQELFTIKGYLESILFNLINNSIKFKSTVRKPEITITTKKDKDKVVISVADNGIGIDLAKQKHKIFGLYHRFHLEVEGKGLGLYMCKSQVEALGGSIWVESELDKGSIFTFALPLN